MGERFWVKVERSQAGCWTWLAGANAAGYGLIRHRGRSQLAHRIAWELTNGPIPAGMDVCHRCDNPPCVRPDHLFLGPHVVNMRDAQAKGRMPRGERNGQRKLSDEAVAAIRERYAAGSVTQRELAQEFGVVATIISRVVTGAIWKHV